MRRQGVQVALACLLASACGDQVVGAFTSDGSGTSSGEATTSSSPGTTLATGTVGEGTTGSSTGDGPFVGCFVDDFDDGTIDRDLWNPFEDGGALIEESSGTLRLIPADVGLAYSGVTLGFAFRYDVSESWVRFQLASGFESPRPVNTYLQLGDDDNGNYVLRVRQDGVAVISPDGAGDSVLEEFPEFGAHRHFGLRESGGRIVFEASADGSTWEVVTDRALIAPVERTKLLIMAETAGDNADQTPIAIDRIEACSE